MESLLNFITDNLWLIIAALIFLSGLNKSKKKKGDRVEQELPEKDDFDFSEEEAPSPIDDLPLPESIKKLMREVEVEEKPFKTKPQKTMPPAAEKPMPIPQNSDYPQGHYDNPWSGEGKALPHQEVSPTNTIEPAYGSNGKIFAKEVVAPQDKPSYVKDPMPAPKETVKKIKKALAENQDAYAERTPSPVAGLGRLKLAEAVVMSEVLAKPKALRRK